MASYFLDTEFIEGFHKPLFGKRRHFIDLISIGIVCEDGREYQAISNEYDYGDASEWVRENVIKPLYISTVHGDARNHLRVDNFHKNFGKSNKQIAQEIITFVNPPGIKIIDGVQPVDYYKKHNCDVWTDYNDGKIFVQPTFYGYYADYDWVLFCSLFGTMMDLPNGFPMYMRDLKQILDDYSVQFKEGDWGFGHDISALNKVKSLPGYPKQTDEHNALSDARWNRDLYNFLTK